MLEDFEFLDFSSYVVLLCREVLSEFFLDFSMRFFNPLKLIPFIDVLFLSNVSPQNFSSKFFQGEQKRSSFPKHLTATFVPVNKQFLTGSVIKVLLKCWKGKHSTENLTRNSKTLTSESKTPGCLKSRFQMLLVLK